MVKGVAKVLVTVALLFVCSLAYSVIERSLIDFPQFDENMATVLERDQRIHNEVIEQNPEMDFSLYGYPKVEFTIDDWKLDSWRIVLASSANTIKNNTLSYCRSVPSQRFGNVLGARIHFPKWRFLSWALVMPPYELFVYHDNGAYVNETADGGENSLVMGVLANVGQVKSISSWVYGLNYTHQVGLRIRDRDERIHEYFMGSTHFDGWRRLVWMNPNYAESVGDRSLQRVPLYPRSYPFIKFDSYAVYKPEIDSGGDYVIYFKDVVVNYDRAIIREELDIDDEAAWGILATETLERKMIELKRIGDVLKLRRQEERRMRAAGQD